MNEPRYKLAQERIVTNAYGMVGMLRQLVADDGLPAFALPIARDMLARHDAAVAEVTAALSETVAQKAAA